MIRCRCCGCFCDPGDTVNGICDECREEIEQEEQKENKKIAPVRLAPHRSGTRRYTKVS